MKVIVQVPIKGHSERVPHKNLREVAGKPLFAHLLDRFSLNMPHGWTVVVDTEASEVAEAIVGRYDDRFAIHRRDAWYASDEANGNHLLQQFAHVWRDADVYVQAFVTAPRLTIGSIARLVDVLDREPSINSATHVVPENGWFWQGNDPLNYDPDRPDGLPRSQDAQLLRETTGAYAVRRTALLRTGCRLAAPSRMVVLDDRSEAIDIDTFEDLKRLEADLAHAD